MATLGGRWSGSFTAGVWTINDGNRLIVRDVRDESEKPSISSVGDASATEGNTLSFTVRLSGRTSRMETYYYSTYFGGDATAERGDYDGAKQEPISVGSGQSSFTILIQTHQDADDDDETFYLYATGEADHPEAPPEPSKNRGTGTIHDDNEDEPAEKPSITSVEDASATEGSTLSFTVRLSGRTSRTETYYYTTYYGGATAERGEDYDGAVRASVSVGSGQSSFTILIQTHQDADDDDETFYLYVTGEADHPEAPPEPSKNRGIGTIHDNDTNLQSETDPEPSQSNSITTISITLKTQWENKAVLGKSINIKWEFTGEPDQVVIDLTRDGGQNWENLVILEDTITNWDWEVTGPSSDDCRIRIIGVFEEETLVDEGATFRIVDEYKYGKVITWPATGKDLMVECPQSQEMIYHIYVGKNQQIDEFTVDLSRPNGNTEDVFDITIESPSGQVVFSSDRLNAFPFTLPSPEPGIWTMNILGVKVWDDLLNVETVFGSEKVPDLDDPLDFIGIGTGEDVEDLPSWMQETFQQQGFSVTRFTVRIEDIILGDCSEDDLLCQDWQDPLQWQDFNKWPPPALWQFPIVEIKEIVQTMWNVIFLHGYGFMYFFTGEEIYDDLSSQHNSSAMLGIATSLPIVNRSMFKSLPKLWKMVRSVLRFKGGIKVVKGRSQIPPFAKDIIDYSDPDKFDFKAVYTVRDMATPYIKRRSDLETEIANLSKKKDHSSNVDEGTLRRYQGTKVQLDVMTTILGDPNGKYIPALLGRNRDGIDVRIFRKEKNGAYQYKIESNGSPGTGSGWKEFTDMDVVAQYSNHATVPPKFRGTYVIVQVKSRYSKEAIRENTDSIHKIREALNEIEEFKNNYQIVGLVGGKNFPEFHDDFVKIKNSGKMSAYIDSNLFYLHNLGMDEVYPTLIIKDAVYVNDDQHVVFRFHTDQEFSNKGWIIQRTVVGNQDLQRVSSISSKGEEGNSSVPLEYAYTDTTVEGDTQYLYRILQYNLLDLVTELDTILVSTGGIANAGLLGSVEDYPAVITTPNGDRVNDLGRISYDLVQIIGDIIGDAEVSIEIRDLSGRVVRQVYEGRDRLGSYTREWDGRDDAGQAVPPGIYLYRIGVVTEGDREAVRLGLVNVAY